VECSDADKMRSEGRFHHTGQHGDAILIPFAFAHDNVIGAEVYIFDAQPQTFHQPQSSPVEQMPHQPWRPLQRI